MARRLLPMAPVGGSRRAGCARPSARRSLDDEASYCHCDVSRGRRQGLIDHTASRFGRVDVLVNNAALRARAADRDIDAEAFDATVGVLLRSVFLGIKHVAPVMKRKAAAASSAQPASRAAPGWPASAALPRRR
jgi:NAD(P)-dependent dehydrogenase (short-subunit alcohol dehydrogenase family)